MNVPMGEYMKGMHLRTWILTLLDSKAVHGLEYVRNDNEELSFQFPWAKLGDTNWEKNWDILFKYAEHKGIQLPSESNLEERKKELGKLKNKFRNAMNKSRDFELMFCSRNHYQYRIVTESHPKANSNPPTPTFQRKEVQSQEFRSPAPTSTYYLKPQHRPYPFPSEAVHSEKKICLAEGAVTNHQPSFSGESSFTEMLGADINPQQEVVTSMACEEANAGQQQMDVDEQPQYTTLQPAITSGAAREPTPQQPVENIPSEAAKETPTEQPTTDIPQDLSGKSRKPAPNPSEVIPAPTSSLQPQAVQHSISNQTPGNPFTGSVFAQKRMRSSEEAYVQPSYSDQSSQDFYSCVSPRPNNPDVTPSKSSLSPNKPHLSTGEVLQKFNITDDEMSVFDIHVTMGQQVIHDSLNLKNGFQIIFTRDCNKILRQHDYAIGDLLDEVNNQKRYRYSGNNHNVKKIIECSHGGIILKYTGKSLYVYRLCQARVYVEGPNHQIKRKLERCCSDSGITMQSTFSYSKLISVSQRNPEEKANDWTTITIGTDSVSVKVYPRCAGRLRELLKVPKVEEGQAQSGEFNSKPFSFEDQLNNTTTSLENTSINNKD